jgi:UDP-glucuronate 4-epimerase
VRPFLGCAHLDHGNPVRKICLIPFRRMSAFENLQCALVTGCAGFIGSHLAESLLADGFKVIGIDCFNDNYGRDQKLNNLRRLIAHSAMEFVPIDLARGELDELVRTADVIFHLAAEPGVRTSWGARYEQYLRNNLLATQHLLESLRREPGRRMVYASSSSVYGNALVRPTPEHAELRPRSPYGQTKAAMEALCNLYRENFDADVVGLRYFTVFGPRQRPDMAFHRICRAALLGDEFTVFGDGSQTRDFSFVGDVVDVTRSAATADLSDERVFNVGGGAPASLTRAIEIVTELSTRGLRVRYAESEHGDVLDSEADTTLSRKTLEYNPSVSLADGLAAEFQWLASELVETRRRRES